jgi:hypothetical protein
MPELPGRKARLALLSRSLMGNDRSLSLGRVANIGALRPNPAGKEGP